MTLMMEAMGLTSSSPRTGSGLQRREILGTKVLLAASVCVDSAHHGSVCVAKSPRRRQTWRR
eukprot:3060169-Lingulodinium_polyedra.AAC.1